MQLAVHFINFAEKLFKLFTEIDFLMAFYIKKRKV